eukprot:1824591-Heterocapsa_arctica.AAC.1
MQEAIRGIERKFEKLTNMHNESAQIAEELKDIREIMNIMMEKVANWIGANHPDRDRSSMEDQEQHRAMGEDWTGKAAKQQKEDRTEVQAQEMMEEDIRNIRNFRPRENTEGCTQI